MSGMPLRRWDVVVPAALALVGVLEVVIVRPPAGGIAAALELVAGAVLVGRRFRPVAASLVASMATLVLPWVGPQLNDLAAPLAINLLAVFTLGRRVALRTGLLVLAALAALIVLDYGLVDLRVHDWTDVTFVGVVLGAPYAVGRLVARLDRQHRLLADRAELVRREAVSEERLRIARDLHDLIAHSISAMVVQTEAARDLVERDPVRAAAVLDRVTGIGRQALAETGQVLHLVRDDSGAPDDTPAPRLSDLDQLVAAYRERGLTVRLRAEPPPDLPAAVELSAYRIVQELLTNALRHSRDRSVDLGLAAADDRLVITASNPVDGRPAGDRLGLLGMAERAAAVGGQFAYRTRDGRFEVTSTLPASGR